MDLIKKRPKIHLLLPPELYPGHVVRGEVRLEATRRVTVDYVRIELLGRRQLIFGSGKSARYEEESLLRVASRLCERAVLTPGTRRLPFTFELPGWIPPSYSGARALIEYKANVRAGIDWWPDARQSFVARVQALPWDVTEGAESVLYSTSPEGPTGEDPHLELSLASPTVVVGDLLRGAVAFGNVAHNPYQELRVSLVAHERVRFDSEVQRLVVTMGLGDMEEGHSVPLRVRVPESAHPTTEAGEWGLRWELHVEAKLGFGRRDVDMRVPLTFLPKGSAVPAGVRKAPPAIGSERLQRVWLAVAEESGMTFDGEQMAGRFDDVSLVVRRDVRGRDGLFVVAELGFPELGLSLDGGLNTGFHRFLVERIASDLPAWDRRHYLRGREAAQARAFVEVLMPELAAFDVSDLADDRIIIQTRDAGLSHAPLRRFVAAAQAVALRIGPARRAIPPPASMAEAVPAWGQLAKRLDGTLEKARMAVVGRHAGVDSEIATEWSGEGEPLRTAVVVRPDFPIDEDYRVLVAGGEVMEGDLSRLPRDARIVLQALTEKVDGLSIENTLEASLPAPLLNPEPARRTLGMLARLASMLRANAGPYR